LESYDFPGNVRELKNLIERALIECGGATILPDHLHGLTAQASLAGSSSVEPGDSALKRKWRFPAGSDEDRVLRYVETNDNITNPECRHLLKVGIHRASYILRKLSDSGDLERTNVGKATEYRRP
jgi:DNA-binding NtrC family response regulator